MPKRKSSSGGGPPTGGYKEPSKREQMASMADSTAHQMATMHPDFQRLKDGMKTQVMRMMRTVATPKAGGKAPRGSSLRIAKGGYDGATNKRGGMKRG